MISIWEEEAVYGTCDILIVGGGLLGLWTALECKLADPTLKITVLEALPVPALASTRNAGFACFGSPSELWDDAAKQGEMAMLDLVDMRYRGIRKIREVLGDEVIEMDICGGFEVFDAGAEWEGNILQQKLDWLNQGFQKITGLSETYTKAKDKMQTFGLSGFANMVGNSIEGGLHSGKLVQALWQKVVAAGVVYLTGHKVGGVENIPQNHFEITLIGKKEIRIRTEKVVWATNAGLSGLENAPVEVKPARGQILLSPVIEGLSLRGTFHYDEGFYYFRNLGNRLLLGGGRNAAFEAEASMVDEPTTQIKEVLEHFIRKHLPRVAPHLNQTGWMHWAGIMGMSEQKQPFIIEKQPGEWVALACNGMGVALTPIVAERLKEKIIASRT